MNLYELAPQIRDIEAAIEESEGDEAVQLFELLDALKGTEVDVATNVVKAIENLGAYADALKAEEKKLAEKRKSLERREDRYREYLLGYMKAMNIDKIDAQIRKVSRRAPSTQLIVDPKEVIHWPDTVVAACVTYEVNVNKSALKQVADYLKLPGVSELEGKESIQIR